MKKFLSLFTVAFLASMGARADSPAQSLPYTMPRIASCNVRLALEDFRDAFGGSRRPLGDGYMGWGKIAGLWVDPSRDLVILVQVKKPSKQAPTEATVRFYSLCSSKLMAKGFQIADASIRSDDPLRLMMTMANGRTLGVNLALDRVNDQTCRETLKVQVLNPAGSNPVGGRLLDEFKVSRF